MYIYMHACTYVCVYNTHIYNGNSCTVCVRKSGTGWITCMLGCSPCTLDTCPGWLSSCRLFFCTVLCITRQLLTSDAQTLTGPYLQKVLSGLCKAEQLAYKAVVDTGQRQGSIFVATGENYHSRVRAARCTVSLLNRSAERKGGYPQTF